MNKSHINKKKLDGYVSAYVAAVKMIEKDNTERMIENFAAIEYLHQRMSVSQIDDDIKKYHDSLQLSIQFAE